VRNLLILHYLYLRVTVIIVLILLILHYLYLLVTVIIVRNLLILHYLYCYLLRNIYT